MNMMLTLKDFVRRTPLHGLIQQRRIWKALQKWDEADQRMLEFYSQFIRPGDLCFDVGANVGNRSKVFLKLGATVVAVEPQPQCTRMLQKAFGTNSRFKLIQKAAGESVGQAEMMVSQATTISSMSSEWVSAVKKSGRFSNCSWDTKRIVPVTTLDRLIEEHGAPAFIKIDVEGYEYPVVKGLSKPVRALSLEFTPEVFESLSRCIEHLSSLGEIHLNYSLGESMQLGLKEWIDPQAMLNKLSDWRDDHVVFGDVYLRFDMFGAR